jgi:hypothetical protein
LERIGPISACLHGKRNKNEHPSSPNPQFRGLSLRFPNQGDSGCESERDVEVAEMNLSHLEDSLFKLTLLLLPIQIRVPVLSTIFTAEAKMAGIHKIRESIMN